MKRIIAPIIICALLLSGCGKYTPSDMYAVPEMPETHSALIETVNSVRDGGYDYAEPRSGINRQSLQLMDLDGDGEEEGVAFLRDVTETYKTFIYIFEASESGFRLFDIIEGSVNEIYTVSYADILGKNGYEIIVEWGTEQDENRPITIYNQKHNGMEKILDISAEEYSVNDMDGDGKNEFITVLKKNGKRISSVYASDNGEVLHVADVPLSSAKGEILGMKATNTSDGFRALFIEHAYGSGVITDAVICVGGEYKNILPEGDVCKSRMLCADVNGDGISDIPRLAYENGEDKSGNCYIWRDVSSAGAFGACAFTYHPNNENWYALLPVAWSGSVRTKRSVINSGKVEILFATRELLGDDEESYIEAPLFKLLVLTGNNRDAEAAAEGRIIISSREEVIYAAEIISESYLLTTINEEFIKSIFKTRESYWASDILFA